MGIFIQKWTLKKSGQVGVVISSVWSLILLIVVGSLAGVTVFFMSLPSIALFWAFGSLTWGILIYWFVGNWDK